MIHPTILVTGATGKTGGAVVSQLLQLGWPVRALVRAPDARSERLRAQGAEIAVADLVDPEQLLEAMRGTARAYYGAVLAVEMLKAAEQAVRSAEADLKRAAAVRAACWAAESLYRTTLNFCGSCPNRAAIASPNSGSR